MVCAKVEMYLYSTIAILFVSAFLKPPKTGPLRCCDRATCGPRASSWIGWSEMCQCQHISVILSIMRLFFNRSPHASATTVLQVRSPWEQQWSNSFSMCRPFYTEMWSTHLFWMLWFPESAIKWKGWLPLCMLCAAGRTHKPHPKHSQETHKDPTGQDVPLVQVVNSTEFAFRSGAQTRNRGRAEGRHCIGQ